MHLQGVCHCIDKNTMMICLIVDWNFLFTWTTNHIPCDLCCVVSKCHWMNKKTVANVRNWNVKFLPATELLAFITVFGHVSFNGDRKLWNSQTMTATKFESFSLTSVSDLSKCYTESKSPLNRINNNNFKLQYDAKIWARVLLYLNGLKRNRISAPVNIQYNKLECNFGS